MFFFLEAKYLLLKLFPVIWGVMSGYQGIGKPLLGLMVPDEKLMVRSQMKRSCAPQRLCTRNHGDMAAWTLHLRQVVGDKLSYLNKHLQKLRRVLRCFGFLKNLYIELFADVFVFFFGGGSSGDIPSFGEPHPPDPSFVLKKDLKVFLKCPKQLSETDGTNISRGEFGFNPESVFTFCTLQTRFFEMAILSMKLT